MADLNNISITGRLGQDSEGRFTTEGTFVLSFSVGNGTYKKGASDYNTLTTWYRVTMFGARAESLHKLGALVKGTRVGVTGVHSMRSWTDNEGGERLSCDISANEITLMDGKGDNSANNGHEKPAERQQAQSRPATRPAARNVAQPVADEDLPF